MADIHKYKSFVKKIVIIALIVIIELAKISIIEALKLSSGVIFISLINIVLAWLIIYLATTFEASTSFRAWLARKEAALSGKARMALHGGKWLMIITTSLTVGIVAAAILILMMGFEIRKVYLYSALCSILVAIFWCCAIKGLFWEVHVLLFH